MRTRQTFFILFLVIGIGLFTDAHASNTYLKPFGETEITESADLNTGTKAAVLPAVQDPKAADFDEFPNLHPLVVHFPIVLLILAVILQLIQLFTMTRTMDWVILLTVGLGFIGAYVAANFVHPHTDGLTPHLKALLEQHDKYAMWAMWSSAAAAVLKILSLFLVRQKRWFEILVFLIMAFAGYSVGVAGHYGSQLVYIEGVGPQGKFIGHEEGHHQH